MKMAVDHIEPPGLENRKPHEEADIQEIIRGILAIQAQAAADQKRPLSRGTHAKGTCVRAEFEVFDFTRTPGDPTLGARLAQGLFARPGKYPAIVRFANADGRHREDRWRDVRALSFAVQLPPDLFPGMRRLDFSMNSATTFPINDAHAFAVAVRVLSAQGARAKWKALRSLSRPDWKDLLGTIWLGRKQQKGTPLLPYQQLRYWSTVPYQHGTREAIKYSATPQDNPARPLQSGPNRLQDELVRHVNEDAQMSAFAFALQLLEPELMTHKGERREPSFWIENATVEWKEAESPFYTVGRLRLLPQSLLTPAEAEAFAIDVTENSLPESRPIGSINRARWHGEAASRQARQQQPLAATSWTPVRRGPSAVKLAFGVALLMFAAALGWAMGPVAKDLPERYSTGAPPLGRNGLSDEDRGQYYHLSEGGEAYPIAWLLALEQQVEDETTGEPRFIPFLENIERFGFLPDPPGKYNPYGLPVGVTAGYGKITGQQMMGLNCTACHVGELHYNGRPFRVDGGQSMAYINAFIKGIVAETHATATDAARRRRFLDRWRRVQLVPLPEFPAVQRAGIGRSPRGGTIETLDAGDPGVIWRVLSGLRSAAHNRSLLMDKLHGFSAIKFVQQAEPLGTSDGYGRNDAFGVGRTELFGAYKDANFAAGLNVLPADAPVSFPHLWGMQHTAWFQWGVNTNSVLERNIGQALGVGATFQPEKGFNSTVRLDNLHAMELFQYKLTAPQWPEELLGPIDRARAARGKQVFDRTCALCHESYEKKGSLNDYKLFALDVVGTDPGVAINFERMVMTPEGAKPFGMAAFEIVKKVKDAYYRENQVPENLQRVWEAHATRGAPQYRTPLRDYDKYYDTRHRGIYRAKTLKGIWATAPFLHNGSVPTLYDLLLPAEARPKTFPLGTREYDPVKVGYVTSGPRKILPTGMVEFEYDTTRLGNWNTGHEWWFYAELDDQTRYDIIEFLKTFDDAHFPGDYTFERPERLPDEVRAKSSVPGPGVRPR